jgi:capsid protein
VGDPDWLRSADADIVPDKPTLDARARDMLRNDAYVQGGANLHKDNIVGAQFLLNARPATRVLFGKEDDVWEEEFQEEVEELWELFADSPDNWVDAAPRQQPSLNWSAWRSAFTWRPASAGDRRVGPPGRSEFNTCIQMVDLDRLSTDPMSRMTRGPRRHPLQQRGAPLAYQIRTQHPQDIVGR